MYNWTHNNVFEFYFTDKSNNIVDSIDWTSIQDDYLAQFSILNELLENGNAVIIENKFFVEDLEILKLSDSEKNILSLPRQNKAKIFIQGKGLLNSNEFFYTISFFDFLPYGKLLSVFNGSSILNIDGEAQILTLDEYILCNSIKEFNSISNELKTYQNNLLHLDKIKELATSCNATFDNIINNEDVFIPNKIKLDVNYSNGILSIQPEVEKNDNETFQNQSYFKKQFKEQSVREIYDTQDVNKKRTRVVISDKKELLDTLKNKSSIASQEEINDLIENSEKYFNDDIIDLENFSERVKEIGIYKPKFYPFICPYKSEWIPGMLFKDKLNGEKKIYFKTIEELNSFSDVKEKKIREGKDKFIWNEYEINITEADKFIEIASEQLRNKEKPLKIDEDTNKNKVIIIKENAEFLEYVEDNEIRKEFIHKFYPINNLNIQFSLKNHQKEGIAWMQSLYSNEFKGCLLADDMGLGKTIQILYFLEWHSQNNKFDKPYLIVAPVSLLENWENEYNKFFISKTIDINVLYGSNEISKHYNESDVKKLQNKQIILTNYESLKTYQMNICAVNFAVVALDEAQKIKTPGTLITNVCKALKADFKIAMTGTPVENTLVDLWCLMDFAMPGFLGNAKDFSNEFQKPLKEENVDIKLLGVKLRNRIDIFIKRRFKKDVAKDLPFKYESNLEKDKLKFNNINVVRTMPSVQYNRYIEEIEKANNQELEGIEKRNQILSTLWAIREISDHPYIADNKLDDEFYKTININDFINNSAKLQALMAILYDVHKKNEKAIIFSDRKETQKMLQFIVSKQFNIYPSIINGDSPSSVNKYNNSKLSRQQTIDYYQSQNGFNVIVMSPLAAGVGLNVVGANHVIHYSRHWNPAKEEQATDRAYRIGQTKDVYVYYPMAIFPESKENPNNHKSFDVVLNNLLLKKKELANGALYPSEQVEVKQNEIINELGFNN
jgi:SNF2 family DNA or RNA helicase